MRDRLKSLLRPRLWIALFAGIGAAAFAWLLPPLPNATVRLPVPANRKDGAVCPFDVRAISSAARFLVTFGQHHDAKKPPTLHVWDRERGLDQAVLPVGLSDEFDSFHALFSPDETKLAVIAFRWDVQPLRSKSHVILLYDLESAGLLERWETKPAHAVFARDGRLLAVTYDTLTDLETGAEIRRLPKQIGDHHLTDNSGELAIYRRDQHVLVYSWLTGECEATHDLVGNIMTIQALSYDGQVIHARGWPKTATPWSVGAFSIVRDARTACEISADGPAARHAKFLSPDGRTIAEIEPTKRPTWLPKWFPIREGGESLHVAHWMREEHLAKFRYDRVRTVLFSPRGNQLAVLRDEGVIDVYAFPFAKPWPWIVAAGLAAASTVWTLGWMWSRWRAQRQSAAATSAPYASSLKPT